MNRISKISFKEAVKIAKKIKKQGGVGARAVGMSNREDSLNKVNLKSESLLKSLKR